MKKYEVNPDLKAIVVHVVDVDHYVDLEHAGHVLLVPYDLSDGEVHELLKKTVPWYDPKEDSGWFPINSVFTEEQS